MKKAIVIAAILIAYGLGMITAFKVFESIMAWDNIGIIIRVIQTNKKGSP